MQAQCAHRAASGDQRAKQAHPQRAETVQPLHRAGTQVVGEKSTFTSPWFRWHQAKKLADANAVHICSNSTSPGTGADATLRPTIETMDIITRPMNTAPPASANARALASKARPSTPRGGGAAAAARPAGSGSCMAAPPGQGDPALSMAGGRWGHRALLRSATGGGRAGRPPTRGDARTPRGAWGKPGAAQHLGQTRVAGCGWPGGGRATAAPWRLRACGPAGNAAPTCRNWVKIAPMETPGNLFVVAAPSGAG